MGIKICTKQGDKMALTDMQIKKATAKEKEYTLKDGEGLFLAIYPDGRKQWIFRYTSPATKKRRKPSLGMYPKISLLSARKKRDEYQAMLNQDIDPLEAKQEAKEQKVRNEKAIFENVFNKWIEGQRKNIAEITYGRRLSKFNATFLPAFKGRDIATIRHDEVITVLKVVLTQSGADVASRLFNQINDLWWFAKNYNYCDFNIISNIHKKSIIPPIKEKHHPKITNPAILKELIEALYNCKGHHSTKNAFKFVLHVPLRPENLTKLRWEQIDFNEKKLTIAREEMKTWKLTFLGDFVLPLTDEAIAILKEQSLFTSHKKYVFVSSNQAEHVSNNALNQALHDLGFNDEKAGRKTRLRGFRGTFSSLERTFYLEHKMPKEVKEMALDHVVGNRVERSYSEKANYFEQMKILFTWWSNYLLELKNK